MMHSILKRHIIILVVMATTALLAIASVWFLARMVEARTVRVISAKDQLASYEENKKIFTDESRLLALIRERETRLEAYRITPGFTPELLSALEDLAESYGVVFSIVSVQTPGEGATQKLLIDFSAEGSRTALDAFLVALSHQTYQLRFMRASLFIDRNIKPVVTDGTPTTPAPTKIPAAPKWSLLATVEVVSY